MLLMQFLSLYLQFYAKSNFNILYTYMLNVFMLQLCRKSRTVTHAFLIVYNLAKKLNYIFLQAERSSPCSPAIQILVSEAYS